MRARLGIIALVVLAASLFVSSAECQWEPNGTLLSTIPGGDKGFPFAIPDGSAGAIIVWIDVRQQGPVSSKTIYAQRLNASGVPQWPSDGVAVTGSSAGFVGSPVAVGDGAGGAIIAWSTQSPVLPQYEVRAQRINSAGEPVWGTGGTGVPICDGSGSAAAPLLIISDFRNDQVQGPGAIMGWPHSYLDPRGDLIAQAVDANGVVKWAANCVEVRGPGPRIRAPLMVTDGTGGVLVPKGALLLWGDDHLTPMDTDLYARRVSSDGVPQGSPDGLSVCAAPGTQTLGGAAFVGSGSSIIAWQDDRSGNYDIYVQKVNAAGTLAWEAAGVPLCQQSGAQLEPVVISDTFGSGIVAWRDGRTGDDDIYAQVVGGTGTPGWLPDGIGLCTATGEQSLPTLVPDLAGGAVAIWVDKRRGTESDIYAQRVNYLGEVQWAPNGVPVCRATGDQVSITAVGDFAGGAIVAWTDRRSGAGNIYANRVPVDGSVVSVGPTQVGRFRLHDPFPNPTSGWVSVSFDLVESAKVTAKVFGVDGRLIRTLAVGEEFEAGLRTLHWDGKSEANKRLSTGVYFLKVSAGADSDVRQIVLTR